LPEAKDETTRTVTNTLCGHGLPALALFSDILVTAVYMICLLVRRKPRVFGIWLDFLIMPIIYVASVWAYYAAR
jgi:hypothetical protein